MHIGYYICLRNIKFWFGGILMFYTIDMYFKGKKLQGSPSYVNPLMRDLPSLKIVLSCPNL